MKYQVIEAYNDAPDHPIMIDPGEVLAVVEESDPNGPWPNWVFCKGTDKEGWVPKQILDIQATKATVTQAYCAREHTLIVGEILIAGTTLNGWIWGTKEDYPEKCAWAPLSCLQAI